MDAVRPVTLKVVGHEVETHKHQKTYCLEIWGDSIRFISTYWDDGNITYLRWYKPVIIGFLPSLFSEIVRELQLGVDRFSKYQNVRSWADISSKYFKLLLIRFSDVCCSKLLWTSPLPTNTKPSSWVSINWGCNSDRKSDFKSAPASFENIVEAMAKNGLEGQSAEARHQGLRAWRNSGAGTAQQARHCRCFSCRDWSRSEGVMADRKTARLIEFEESDWLDLKTFYNSLSFKQRL